MIINNETVHTILRLDRNGKVIIIYLKDSSDLIQENILDVVVLESKGNEKKRP